MDTADHDQGEPTYPSGEKFAEAETAAFSARVAMSLIPIPGVGTALGELLAAVLRMPMGVHAAAETEAQAWLGFHSSPAHDVDVLTLPRRARHAFAGMLVVHCHAARRSNAGERG